MASRARESARELDASDGLDAYKKPELVQLAAGIGLETRAKMTKDELVDVITRAARQQAREGVRA